MIALSALLVTSDGLLEPVQVNRPGGGGLRVLGRLLGCDDYQVTAMSINRSLSVWHDDRGTFPTTTVNPTLTRMLELLGLVDQPLGGVGLFMGTVPGRYKSADLTPSQVERITKAWENARAGR